MNALRTLVLWSVPALVLAAAVLIYAGTPVLSTLASCVGLLVIVMIVYGLDRSGLMQPPTPRRPSDDATDGRRRR